MTTATNSDVLLKVKGLEVAYGGINAAAIAKGVWFRD